MCFNELWYSFSDVQILPSWTWEPFHWFCLVCRATRVLYNKLHTLSETQNKHLSFTQWVSASGWLGDSAYLLADLLPGLDDQLAPGWSGMASSQWLGNSAVLHICFSSWGPKTGPDMLLPQPWQTSQTVQVLLRCLLVPIPVTHSRHASEPTVKRRRLAKLDTKAVGRMGWRIRAISAAYSVLWSVSPSVPEHFLASWPMSSSRFILYFVCLGSRNAHFFSVPVLFPKNGA